MSLLVTILKNKVCNKISKSIYPQNVFRAKVNPYFLFEGEPNNEGLQRQGYPEIRAKSSEDKKTYN